MGVAGAIRFAAAAAVLAASFACAPAFAEDWIYLQRQDGVRTYSDVRPSSGPYTKLPKHGRTTATSACLGLTADMLQQRAALYAPEITKVAKKHGLSPKLVSAVMRVESCYDPRAVSRAGARGLMQLMPATAHKLGVHDSFDPLQNLEGGVRYLATLLQRFNYDLRLGLAAYNAGPEVVEAYKDVPPFPETKSYVGRIMKFYRGT